MGKKAGLGLKFLQWFIRGVQFLCAALILGIYSYFLATLHNHDLRISTTLRAVEGIAGAAVLYTLIAFLLLWCLAGRAVTAFLAMALDLAFAGAFIYVAVANRQGASSCNGYLDTPFGRGQSRDTTDEGSDGFTALPSFRTACRLQSACLAVAIIAIFFFIFSLFTELALARHHRKEKRFGPSPANGYTSGYGSSAGDVPEKKQKKPGFFGRMMPGRNKRAANDFNNNALPQHATPADLHNRPADNRASYNTEATAIGHDNPDHLQKPEAGYAGHGYQNRGVAEMGGTQPPRVYGSRQATANGPTAPGTAPPQNYRYDDGVY
ncbi:hypothetical protein NLU13_1887 [Sarocladium strictum]|uniref:MARVEL domain-containing protein n=1 Tax=Sarocladium strictum TaxID=5046 RepID=A0AA39GRU2_SARSR|nr:hypothetical protein NLU13_1887 [Sarocladium strictum]